jgi:hypothetical protein
MTHHAKGTSKEQSSQGVKTMLFFFLLKMILVAVFQKGKYKR